MVRKLFNTRHALDVECFVHQRIETHTVTDWEWFRVLLKLVREVFRLPAPNHRCPESLIAEVRRGKSR